MNRRPMPALAGLLVALLAAACGGDRGSDGGPAALIVVNVPLQAAPTLAEGIRNGADLAVAEINAAGGVDVGGRKVKLRTRVVDSALSPTATLDHVRQAVNGGAVGVIDEGTGIDAAWQEAAAAGLPIGIVYQGASALVDPAGRPNVFRIAPTDRGMSFRLAEYLVPKGLRLGLIHDDSAYGVAGKAALDKALSRNQSSVASTAQIATDGDPSAAVLSARAAGATALVVWARPAGVAAVLRAARSRGWTVPVYSAISGTDPLVRQRLADHPEWVDGFTVAMSRLTAERGPAPFLKFRTAYEKRFGPDEVGVQSGGRDVVLPPDYPMYAYDFVRVLAQAMTIAKADRAGPALVEAMERAEVLGANGDERSFNERNHEGVVDDDIFFARFTGMVYAPVGDDPLSASLPPIPQTR